MPKILILGEAWGETEERERCAFVGYSGHELTKMLTEAGIDRRECFLTNAFNLRPKGNDISTLCGPKSDALPGYPPLAKGKFVSQRYAGELARLGDELVEVNPNLIVALGNTAVWALLGRTGVGVVRGTTHLSTHTVSGFKVLPTYHPAAVGRQWDLRPIVVVDLMKAKRESEYAELRRPKREIWIEPASIDDLYLFKRTYIDGASILSTDIETAGNQITCIGFAPSASVALVVPFLDTRRVGRSYWASETDECLAWKFVRELMHSEIPKLFQNGLYDISFLLRAYGIRVRNAQHDTMLLHHALQPEMLKGLGFLGSIYTDEGAWKQMREAETIKRDD